MVEKGLSDYLFPVFKSSTAALKSFNETEIAKVVAKEAEFLIAMKRTQAAKQTLQDVAVRLNESLKICKSTINQRCPNCLAKVCKDKAESCAAKPDVLEVIALFAKEHVEQAVDFVKSKIFDPAEDFFGDAKDILHDFLDDAKDLVEDIDIDGAISDTLGKIGDFLGSFDDVFSDTLGKIGDIVDDLDIDGVISDALGSIGDFVGSFDDVFKDIIPKIKLPKLDLPKIKLPKISLPKISLPKISLPKISLPKISLPKISLPKISLPKISIPKISFGGGWGKRKRRSIEYTTSVDRPALAHHAIYRRSNTNSQKEPTCDEFKNKNTAQQACVRYSRRPECRSSCTPTYGKSAPPSPVSNNK